MKEHNKYYWENKEKRAESAREHTAEMDRLHKAAIAKSVENTKIYTPLLPRFNGSSSECGVTASILQMDTVSAAFETSKLHGKRALLNFASYKHPGGGFLVGSRAQEESLCHESFLYNVLREFENSYYAVNRQDLNSGLYTNKALYSPNILFERDGEQTQCDVLSCAAPNFSVAWHRVTRQNNDIVLASRIRFILEIAKREHVDTLIVGAFGCGVFKQDPRVVANAFKQESLNVFKDAKIHLVFAVIPPLPNQTDNLTPFVELVNNW